MPDRQRGHQLTTTGLPLLKVSFTTSCQFRILIGYALATPLYSTARTLSCFLRNLSPSDAETNLGLFSAGMPSLGGPPEEISSIGTECRVMSKGGWPFPASRYCFSCCARPIPVTSRMEIRNAAIEIRFFAVTHIRHVNCLIVVCSLRRTRGRI